MRNLFEEYGYSRFDIENKVIDCWNEIFNQQNPNHFYFDCGNGTGYMEDTGNDDARTEGMSYGMMMALQMNRKDIFDRIWKWARDNMYLDKGPMAGYFCWSNGVDGKKNAGGPAPDGEEYFAMALFMASRRWGDGEGIFNYTEEGRAILRLAIHGEQKMWFEENHHIRFVPNCPFTDPSYHLPHFYQLFAEMADEKDRPFWKAAADASRAYILKACHPQTGLAAEYADDDGNPLPDLFPDGSKLPWGQHNTFFSDAYRVSANIGLDALWFGTSPEYSKIAANIIRFFDGKALEDLHDYRVDGRELKKLARHPVGLIATVAEAALALGSDAPAEDLEAAKRAVKRLWDTPMRRGRRRYYDNCLYFFAVLALSGKYVMY
ncbi:MAG: xylanase [Treponema sp.]|nr:xylanase [Treponema sp.]